MPVMGTFPEFLIFIAKMALDPESTMSTYSMRAAGLWEMIAA